jgi:hypothetical protein
VTQGRLAGWATIRVVDPERMLEELCRAASRLGVEIRQRVLRGSHPGAGGLCRIHGESLVLMSSKAPAFERAAIVAQALAELGHASSTELTEECRAFVARHEPRGARVEPKPGRGPGIASTGRRGRRRSI